MSDPNHAQPRSLPGLPQDDTGPVFKEPWEAQAFAMTLKLHEAGCFAWPEWAACLSAVIAEAKEAGDADLGDTYYQHWLKALERIATSKGLTSLKELADRKLAWQTASDHTAHGHPVSLPEQSG